MRCGPQQERLGPKRGLDGAPQSSHEGRHGGRQRLRGHSASARPKQDLAQGGPRPPRRIRSSRVCSSVSVPRLERELKAARLGRMFTRGGFLWYAPTELQASAENIIIVIIIITIIIIIIITSIHLAAWLHHLSRVRWHAFRHGPAFLAPSQLSPPSLSRPPSPCLSCSLEMDQKLKPRSIIMTTITTIIFMNP